jgi:hypothetical protein
MGWRLGILRKGPQRGELANARESRGVFDLDQEPLPLLVGNEQKEATSESRTLSTDDRPMQAGCALSAPQLGALEGRSGSCQSIAACIFT